MSSPPEVDQWLVRTAENYLAGPYTRDQIRQLIREGQLGAQDEVCRGSQFWIMLHEKDEVIRQLGADCVQWLGESGGEDKTLTQTEPSIEDIQLTEQQAVEGMGQGDGSTTVIASLPSSAVRLRPLRAQAAAPSAAEAGAAAPGRTESYTHVSPSGASGLRWGHVLGLSLVIVAALALALWASVGIRGRRGWLPLRRARRRSTGPPAAPRQARPPRAAEGR
jgi:hypothetical protein